ncbi:hypothetical protein ACDX78_10420 [Virgibacillus oceani]
MKILKLIKNQGHYFSAFDRLPDITFERIGMNYVGSALDNNGNIIFSELLKYQPFKGAFAGRELTLKMKDGSTEKIKDHWYAHGSYEKHGKFISIGGGTLEELQKCYVYAGFNINKSAFEGMVEEYLSREKIYDYWEVEKWCNLQHRWHDVVVHGKKIPFMMNKFGNMVEKESKKRVSARYNVVRKINDRFKEYTFFKFKYKDNGKLIKLEANYLDVLKNTLPYTEKEIKTNCELGG